MQFLTRRFEGLSTPSPGAPTTYSLNNSLRVSIRHGRLEVPCPAPTNIGTDRWSDRKLLRRVHRQAPRRRAARSEAARTRGPPRLHLRPSGPPSDRRLSQPSPRAGGGTSVRRLSRAGQASGHDLRSLLARGCWQRVRDAAGGPAWSVYGLWQPPCKQNPFTPTLAPGHMDHHGVVLTVAIALFRFAECRPARDSRSPASLRVHSRPSRAGGDGVPSWVWHQARKRLWPCSSLPGPGAM